MLSLDLSTRISYDFHKLSTDFEYYSDLYGNRQSTPDSSYFSLERNSVISESSSDSFGEVVTGCRKRKQFEPQRAAHLNDPNFRGVTVRMKNQLVDSEWKLLIQPTFSLSPRKKRKLKQYVESSEDEEIISTCIPTNEEKHCASCSVKKTPLWRDAEDGTPLCNACGIRYKKYKMRCGTCWHIPKKDEFHPMCRSCGSTYEYVSPRR